MEHKDYKYNHYRRDKTEDKRKRDTSRSRDRDRKAWKVCCALSCAGLMASSLNLGPILILLDTRCRNIRTSQKTPITLRTTLNDVQADKKASRKLQTKSMATAVLRLHYWGYIGNNGKENGNYYNGFL